MSFVLANAAGWVRSTDRVQALCRTPLTHIVVGSFTLEPREGRRGACLFAVDDAGTGINSLNMPNFGFKELLNHLPTWWTMCRADNKQLVVSLALENSLDDLESMVSDLEDLLPDQSEPPVLEVEINLSCPNRDTYDLPCFDADLLEDLCSQLREYPLRYWFKAAPFTNLQELGELIEVLDEHSAITEVVPRLVLSNTIPNGVLFGADGESLLQREDGGVTGGISGTALRSLAQANCVYANDFILKENAEIDLIGCGGISTAAHIRDFRQCGVVGVQVGTAYFGPDDPSIFDRLGRELAEPTPPAP